MVITVTTPSLRKSLKSFDSDRVSKWNVASAASDVSSDVDSVVYRREILFLLRDESEQIVFPFCQAAADARCRYRWPPWPHRLDRGRPRPNAIQVLHFSFLVIQPSMSVCSCALLFGFPIEKQFFKKKKKCSSLWALLTSYSIFLPLALLVHPVSLFFAFFLHKPVSYELI